MNKRIFSFYIIFSILFIITSSSYAQRAPSEAEKDMYTKVIVNLLKASNTKDWDALKECLDKASQDVLKEELKEYFGGNRKIFFKFLKICRHPARFRKIVKVEALLEKNTCIYAKIVLTSNYSYLDEELLPPVENKPIELWICFKEEGGKYKAHLDYPLHDLVYILQ